MGYSIAYDSKALHNYVRLCDMSYVEDNSKLDLIGVLLLDIF